MNPSGSSSTLPFSHSVAGLAPMKQNSPEHEIVCCSPVAIVVSVACSR